MLTQHILKLEERCFVCAMPAGATRWQRDAINNENRHSRQTGTNELMTMNYQLF